MRVVQEASVAMEVRGVGRLRRLAGADRGHAQCRLMLERRVVVAAWQSRTRCGSPKGHCAKHETLTASRAAGEGTAERGRAAAVWTGMVHGLHGLHGCMAGRLAWATVSPRMRGVVWDLLHKGARAVADRGLHGPMLLPMQLPTSQLQVSERLPSS
ncbi:hypothetical protein M3J09_001731 [Ascochyta lentis]